MKEEEKKKKSVSAVSEACFKKFMNYTARNRYSAQGLM